MKKRIYRQEFLIEISETNVAKSFIISCLGIVISFLLFGVDYFRYQRGLFNSIGIYHIALLSHILLVTILIPCLIIYKKRRAIKSRTYEHSWYLNTLCLMIAGTSLVLMSFSAVIDRRSIIPYVAFVLITNLYFIIPPLNRAISNTIGFIVMLVWILLKVPDVIAVSLLIIEMIGIGVPSFLIANAQFRLRYHSFINRKLLEEKNKTIRNENTELMMKTLQSQMNPHFIFNTLNSIQHFLVTNDQKASLTYMNRFSRLVRMIFQQSKEPWIRLEDEVEFLKLYLQLEELRFEKKVKIDFVIDPELEKNAHEVLLPPLIIQPLIENAFKHGLMHKEKDGQLKILFSNDNGCFKVVIEDNGVGRKQAAIYDDWREKEDHESSGLEIIKQRLKIFDQAIPGGDGSRNFMKIEDRINENGVPEGTKIEMMICLTTQNILYDKFSKNN